MKKPKEVLDSRRVVSYNFTLKKIQEYQKNLSTITDIPFDTPLLVSLDWFIPGFSSHVTSNLIISVSSIYCSIEVSLFGIFYAAEQALVRNSNLINGPDANIPLSTILEWRILDKAYLGLTINYPVKSSEYTKLFQ